MTEITTRLFERISNDTNIFWNEISIVIAALKNNELLVNGESTIDKLHEYILKLKNELALLGCVITYESIATITNKNMPSSLYFEPRSNIIQLRLHPNLEIEDQTDTKNILLLQELFRQRFIALKILKSAGLTTFTARYGKLPNQEVFNDVKNQVMPEVKTHLEAIEFPL